MNLINIFNDLRRNPRVVISLILISISFLAAIALTASVGHRGKYWITATDIAAGSRITSQEVKSVSLVQSGIPLNYLGSTLPVEGKYALATLHKGELISSRDISIFSPGSMIRSVPLKVMKNSLPAGLSVGDLIDVYCLANIAGEINASHPLPVKVFDHVKVLQIGDTSNNFGTDIGISVEAEEKSLPNALAQINGSNVVVVKDGE